MRVVVTGAAGFLGRAVVRRLRHMGCDVLAVARSEAPATVRVSHYAETPDADVLIHLAQDSDRARVNAAGEHAVAAARETLRALLDKSYGRVIFGSSAALYGDTDASPRTPVHALTATDHYATLKRESEISVLASGRGIVARLANLYGPGMSAANVLSTILRQIPGQGPLEVMDTTPIRDFLWVEDAAECLALMATARDASTGPFNVGSGTGVSIGDLAWAALDVAGESAREVRASRPGTRFSSIVLDISSTEAHYAWRPRTTLREGLRTLLEPALHSAS